LIKVVLGLFLRAFVVLMCTALATFSLLWNAPGDPALAISMARFNAVVPADVIDQVRAQAGLDAGYWAAFQGWVGPLLVGDFGNSSVTGRAVWPDLAAAISATVPLALTGLTIGLALSIPLAIIATLGLGVAAALTRIIRSGILEARGQPFLPAIKRRGVTKRNIGKDHIAPHAAIPVITVLGLELAFLLEGVIMVEVIFSRPGLGSFLVQAIFARDFPKVQAVVILVALVFVIVNLLIDVAYRLIDPSIGERDA